MTSDLYSAGLTFARCAFTGPTRDQMVCPWIQKYIYILYIYIYIYIYQRNAPANSSKWGSLRLAPTRKRYTLGSLIRPRAVTRCNLAVSGMYMRDFGKMHQIAYTYCSVGITDLKPLTGTSADQLPHRKSRSLATA